jgi:SWI/SNF-related matrix-associated actin-dependent regulator of chromatin subfamily A3
MCRAELADKECLVQPAEEEKEDEEIDVETKSSKTEALMSILQASRKDPKSKVVIFSQWTSFLNFIQGTYFRKSQDRISLRFWLALELFT